MIWPLRLYTLHSILDLSAIPKKSTDLTASHRGDALGHVETRQSSELLNLVKIPFPVGKETPIIAMPLRGNFYGRDGGNRTCQQRITITATNVLPSLELRRLYQEESTELRYASTALRMNQVNRDKRCE